MKLCLQRGAYQLADIKRTYRLVQTLSPPAGNSNILMWLLRLSLTLKLSRILLFIVRLIRLFFPPDHLHRARPTRASSARLPMSYCTQKQERRRVATGHFSLPPAPSAAAKDQRSAFDDATPLLCFCSGAEKPTPRLLGARCPSNKDTHTARRCRLSGLWREGTS